MAKIRFDFKPVSLRWPAGDKYRIRFDYESHNKEAYCRIVDAIAKAIADPEPEKSERQSCIGFSMDQ